MQVTKLVLTEEVRSILDKYVLKKRVKFPDLKVISTNKLNNGLIGITADKAIKLKLILTKSSRRRFLEYGSRKVDAYLRLESKKQKEFEKLIKWGLEDFNPEKTDYILKLGYYLGLADQCHKSGLRPTEMLDEYVKDFYDEAREIYEVNNLDIISSLSVDIEFDYSGIQGEIDLVIDDTVIDLKTTSKKSFDKDDYYQIILYSLIWKHYFNFEEVNKIGLYYLRFAYYLEITLDDVLNIDSLKLFQLITEKAAILQNQAEAERWI